MDWRDFMARDMIQDAATVNPHAAHWRAVLANRDEPLSEDEGYALLTDYGIPVPRHRIVTSRVEAVAAAVELGLPVVLKTATPGILHKSDVGGVRLNLRDPEAVGEAYDTLAAKLGERVLVCEMAKGQVELALGLVRDAAFGSFVMVAFGGVWIEILKDSQLAMVPLDHEVAARRIAALKMAPVLDGVRGAPPCDREALINAVVCLGALATDLGDLIGELDINPVLVGETGVIALDSLIVPLAKGASNVY
jgi:acyl-CoA synthetase (NDP forming)